MEDFKPVGTVKPINDNLEEEFKPVGKIKKVGTYEDPGIDLLTGENPAPYGIRNDNTPKGRGYFGELKTKNGNVATELSIGVNFDGKETEIPALVPTLNKEEIDHLLNGGKPTKEIVDKAVEHAKERMSSGLSPFHESATQKSQYEIEEEKRKTVQKQFFKDKERDEDLQRKFTDKEKFIIQSLDKLKDNQSLKRSAYQPEGNISGWYENTEEQPYQVFNKIAKENNLVKKDIEPEKIPEVIGTLASALRGEVPNLDPNANKGLLQEYAHEKNLDTEVPWMDPMDPFNLAQMVTGGIAARNAAKLAGKKGMELVKETVKGAMGVAGETKITKPVDTEIMNKQGIVNYLSNELGVNIKTGKYNWKKGQKGVFKVTPEMIRNKDYGDVGTAAHEVGHFIEKKYKINLDDYVDELSKIATVGDPKKEGFAEFIHKFVTNRDAAKNELPGFYNYWEKKLEEPNSQKLKEVLNKTKDKYDKYYSASLNERYKGWIRTDLPEQKTYIRDTIHKIFTEAADQFDPIKDIPIRKIGEQAREVALDAYKEFRRFTSVKDVAETMLMKEMFDYKNKEKITGKSLNTILKPIKNEKEFDEFRKWMSYSHALERAKKGKKSGAEMQDIQKVTTELYSEKFKQIAKDIKTFQDGVLKYLADSGIFDKKSFERIKNAYEMYLPFNVFKEEATGTGKFATGKGAKRITKTGADLPRIDPFESIVKNTYTFINLAEKNRIIRKIADLKKIHGSGVILDRVNIPKTPIKVKASEVFSGIDKEILEELGVDLTDEMLEGLANDITIFRPNAFMPRENIIQHWEKGKIIGTEIFDKSLYNAIKSLDGQNLNMLTKILAVPSQMIKLGAITLNPEFQVARNPIKDTMTAWLFSGSLRDFIPIVDNVKGLYHLMKQDRVFWDMKKYGGGHATLMSTVRPEMQKKLKEVLTDKVSVKEMFKNPSLAGTKIIEGIKSPLESIKKIGDLLEGSTRLGSGDRYFQNRIKAGMSQKEIQELKKDAYGWIPRQATVDFANQGANSLVRFWNATTAFLNPGIQSNVRTAQAFYDNPMDFGLKAALTITAPSLILWNNNKDSEWYKNESQINKDIFWLIPVGGTKDRPEYLIPIPKPHLPGLLFGSLPERMADVLYTHDPHAMGKIWDTIKGSVSSNVVPDIARIKSELESGYSSFYNRSYLSEKELQIEEGYKSSDNQLKMFQDLGQKTGIHPDKFAYLANQVGGGAGGMTAKAANAIYKSLTSDKDDPEEPANKLGDLPFIRALFKNYPGNTSNQIDNLYRNFDNINKKVNTFYHLINHDKNYKEAIQYFNDNIKSIEYAVTGSTDTGINSEEAEKRMNVVKSGVDKTQLIAQAPYIKSVQTTIGQMKEAIMSWKTSKTLTPEEKREKIDDMKIRIMNLARKTNEDIVRMDESKETKINIPFLNNKSDEDFKPIGKIKSVR